MKALRFSVLLPLGWFVFALGYLAFALTMETTAMIGDTRGYDPGGRFVPLVASLGMGVLALWQMVRELARADTPVTFAGKGRLILLYIAVSAAYILLFRHLGYMLSTCAMLFWLTILNARATGTGTSWMRACGWFVFTLAYLAGMYTLLRFVTRSMFRLARAYEMMWLREPAFQAAAVTVVLTAALVLVGMEMKKITADQTIRLTVQSAIGTTLGVYIAFRLLFLVQLPAGLMQW